MLGQILGAIGNVWSAKIQERTARENTDKTIQANRQMAEYQYSKDLEMWNRGNEYNSPTQQMERLKAGGLNPAMVYGGGSGGASGTTATSLPKYNAPTAQFNYAPDQGIAPALSAFQDMEIKQAQLDNLRAQRSATVQETVNKKVYENYMKGGAEGRWLDVDKKEFERSERRALLGIYSGKYGGVYEDRLQELGRSQFEARRESARKPGLNNEYLLEQIENKRLQNEYFLANNFGSMGLRLFGMLSPKLAGRIAGKASGQLSGGTLSKYSGYNSAPRVTPKTELRTTHPAYRVRIGKTGKSK